MNWRALTGRRKLGRSEVSSRTTELCGALTLAAVLVGWQLFVPPIVGLADQGDFLRVLGPLGYAPVPRGPEHKYSYLTRKYVKDASYREPPWDQISSEMIPARIAISLNNLFGDPKTFDLTIFGFTHAVIFLIALARLLYVTRGLVLYRVVWVLILLVLTDVGYVAYWNSLYTEAASCLWFLLLLAESIDLCNNERVSIWPIVRWTAFAVLLIMAKVQYAPLCVPLAAYGMVLAWRAVEPQTRYAGGGGNNSYLPCGGGELLFAAAGAQTNAAL